MSLREFFADVGHANLSHAYERAKDWYSGWPPELKALVESLTDAAGDILMAEARTALANAKSGQSIPQIAEAAWDDIKIKVPQKSKEDFLNALGVLLHAPTEKTGA